jgi:hypothetical protein
MNEQYETTDVESFKYHTSKVVGAFKNQNHAAEACVALRNRGFGDDEIEIYTGLDGERELDLEGKYHGIVQHFKRSLQHFMRADALQLEHYEGCLLRGNHVVQVHTNHETKDAAHEVLRAAGGNHINYYGPLITEVLES